MPSPSPPAAAENEAEAEGDAEGDSSNHQQHVVKYNATDEIITFINFSDQLVQLYWVDTNTGEEFPAAVAHPYQLTTSHTFSGHVFTYRWGPAKFTHIVDETTTTTTTTTTPKTEEKTEKEDEEEKKIIPQIHILGDFQVDTPDKETAYLEYTESQQLNKKIETVVVECGSTEGSFRIQVKPYWSPRGAARFLELIDLSNNSNSLLFDGCALNRVVTRFLTQFGISRDFPLRTKYRTNSIVDDAVTDTASSSNIPFQPGYMSYAGSGPHSRTTEVFVVMPDTPPHQLDAFGENSWETPFGYIETKYLDEVVSKWYADYGDMTPWGNGPDPQNFTNMSYLTKCVIVDAEDLEMENEL
eukprot:CAMPEP_0170761074 /NCGR_PEP_ID=MMETSP0733-20121128/1950_1 /TAXON_ID=186038 /ORGANISM="Fragilariopsis kerguelensis, Strain L26-C5" /LENGTH=355 /DNA_ID=CAMNT_0011100979 /DNA_START=137 /DNA_END=1204 /DNA_ORIENTATION=-